MVARIFVAFDNDNFVVTSSSSAGIVGFGVINNSSTPNGTTFAYTAGSGETITVEDTGGNADIFEDDNAANHVITDGAGLVADGQTAEAESFIFVRALDGSGNPTGPVITITVFSQGGVTGNVWGLSSDTPLVDGTSYVKTGGSNIGSSRYDSFVICFARGTHILTERGQVKIESLQSGDLVETIDEGLRPIRWIGSSTVAAIGKTAPIEIKAGALGNVRDLRVSPQHRMLLSTWKADVLFGDSDALVAAKHLLNGSTIRRVEGGFVEYFHMLFDTHQIVFAEGAPSESFHPGTVGMGTFEDATREEIFRLFPKLRDNPDCFGPSARMCLNGYEARALSAVA